MMVNNVDGVWLVTNHEGATVATFQTNAQAWRFVERQTDKDFDGKQRDIARAFTSKHF